MKYFITLCVMISATYGYFLYRNQGIDFDWLNGSVEKISRQKVEIEWSDQQKGENFYGVSVLPSSHQNSTNLVNNDRNNRFHCDGRIHCSQMTSCDEATFFLANCPGVKMDGDNDGIPCEKQCVVGKDVIASSL